MAVANTLFVLVSWLGTLGQLPLAVQLLGLLLLAQTARVFVKRYLEDRVSGFVILLYKFTYSVN